MKKLTIVLSVFLPVVVLLMLQFACSFFVTFWFSFIIGLRIGIRGIADYSQLLPELQESLTSPLYNDLVLLVAYAAAAILFLLWHRKQKEKPVLAQINEVFCVRNILLSLGIGFALQITSNMGLTIILPLFPTAYDSYMKVLTSLIGGNAFISIITTVVLASIAEEIVFRELMLKQLLKLFPFFIANLIQAAVFGLYHFNLVQGIYTFVIGLFFGFVAYRLKSVWASILLHSVLNASAYVVNLIVPQALLESINGMIIFATLCGSIAILLAFLYRVPNSGQGYAPAPEGILSPELLVTEQRKQSNEALTNTSSND